MHTEPRGGAAIEKIIWHDPEGANTAQELYDYLQQISAGYHALDDDNEEIIAAVDGLIVEGAGGMNTHALHACIVPGRAAWSREQWLVHRPAIERMGRRTGLWCRKYAIPVQILTPLEMATRGVKGIGTHGIVTAAAVYDPIFLRSEGHTDPGSQFPIDVCLAAAQGIADPHAPKEIDDVIVIACPNKPALSPTHQPHAEFLPPSALFKTGAVQLRHGANIKGSHGGIWAPTPAAGHKWVSMFPKIGELDNDPHTVRSKGLTLVDDHGDTTTVDQGLWI